MLNIYTVEIIHFSILMETDEPDVYYGVHSWATYNSKYLKLLEDKKISELSTLSLIKDFKEFVNSYSTKNKFELPRLERSKQNSWFTEKKSASILYLYLFENWSLKSLSSRFEVPIRAILNLSKRFKTELK